MAGDIQKTVEILFTTVNKTGAGLTDINRDLQDIASPVAGLTKDFLLLEGAILAIGVAFGVQAFNNAVKFEDALLDLQKVLGEGEGQASDYVDEVDRLAAIYGVSAVEILQGAADIKQAGFTVAEAFELQDKALRGAVISELSAAEATTVLIRSLKGFKAPIEDAERLLDLFNHTSNLNATNVREVAEGFTQLAPLAKKVGLSYEETIALITPIIETFGSGAEAGNAMKVALTQLLNPTKEAREELARMGVAIKDEVTGEFRSGRDIIFDTVAALSEMEGTTQLASLAMVTTGRQSARLSESLGNQAGVMKILAQQNNATGSSLSEFDVRIKASSKEIDKAQVAYTALSRIIGEQFRVALTDVIKETGLLSNVLADLVKTGGFDDLLTLIEPQLDKWKVLIAGIAKALPEAFENVDFSPIVNAFGNIGNTLEEAFGDFDLTTAEGLEQAIQAIIDGLATMINITDGVANAFLAMAKPIVAVLEWFGQLDSDTQKLLGQFGGLAIGITALSPLVTALSAALNLLGSAGVGGLILKLGGSGGLFALLTGPVGLIAALTAAGVATGLMFKGIGDQQELNKLATQIQLFASQTDQSIEEVRSTMKGLGIDSLEGFQKARDGGLLFKKSLEDLHGPLTETQAKLQQLGFAAEDIEDSFHGPLTKAQSDLVSFSLEAVKTGDQLVQAFKVPPALSSKELENLLNDLGGEFELIENSSGRFITKLEGLDKLTVNTGDSVEGLQRQWQLWQRAVETGNKTAEEGAEAIKKITQALDEKSGVLVEATSDENRYVKQLKDRLVVEEDIVKALKESGASFEEISQAQAAASKTRLELNDATQTAIATIDEDTEATKKNKKEIEKQVEALIKFKLGLEEIQAKERVSKFKISAEVDIAEIEANKDIILAAFGSIEAGMESTGTTLIGLFEQLGAASSVPFGTSELFKQIEKESSLRQDEFALQEKLILSQTELQEAKKKAVEAGEGTIKVTGEGVVPHIKAFMFEILKEIQIEASADAQALLLFES